MPVVRPTLLFAALLSCAPASSPPGSVQSTVGSPPSKPVQAEPSARTEAATPQPSASPAAPGATASATAPRAPDPPRRPFPPPDIAPPHPQSAADGDGRWKPLGTARTKTGTPLLASTTLHPHKASAFATLLLVAIDLDTTRLGFLPGVDDVKGKDVPFAPGLVPPGDRDRLLAVFNGGFLPRHGRWGMRAGSVTVLPPRPVGCTIAIHGDGTVEIRSFSHLASHESTFAAVRQTPPCLVERGAVHPDLSTSRTKAWGGQTPGIVTRRRSAIGLSADGRTLYYAIGVETSPRLLAEGLAAAGVHDAAQLDINWNWTRFFTFEKSSEGTLEVATVLADVEHTKRDYVSRASERDFFFVLRSDGK